MQFKDCKCFFWSWGPSSSSSQNLGTDQVGPESSELEVIASIGADNDFSALLPNVGDAPVFSFDTVSTVGSIESVAIDPNSVPSASKRARVIGPEHVIRTSGIFTFCVKCGAYSGGNRPLRPDCDRKPRNASAARALAFLLDRRHPKKGYVLH